MKQTRAPKLRRRRSTGSARAREVQELREIAAEMREPTGRPEVSLEEVDAQLKAPAKKRRHSLSLDEVTAQLQKDRGPSPVSRAPQDRGPSPVSRAEENRGPSPVFPVSRAEENRGPSPVSRAEENNGPSPGFEQGALDFVLPARPIAMELIAGRGHYERVIAAVTSAHTSVWIATANTKELMVEDPRARPGKRRNHRRGNYVSVLSLLDELAARGVELRLLHAELPSGPFREELAQHPRLVAGGLALRRCPRVHLKVVIVDGEVLYLGSANWTGAGLGAKGSGRRNFELGFVTDDAQLLDQIQAIYEQLWTGGECEGCKLRDECPGPLSELVAPSQITIRPTAPGKRPRKLPMRSAIKRRRIPRLI
jgi:phosphatidylserine/phosphatidylglycerophosphate/cardiolipin synthase-like enzyme